MNRRVDHEFENPAVRVVTCCLEPMPLAKFGVLAEEENLALAAKLCYVSWMIGPGIPIRFRGGN